VYKAAVRAMIRRSVRRLNQGDYGPALAVYAPDATLTFPGDNTWARQFRPPQADREAHPTHRGRAEIEAFLRRYVEQGTQMEVEDILVNGPPWNTRVAVRAHDWVDENGVDVYSNRAVLFVTMRWGRIITHEDYEDTERSAAFDRYSATTTASATSAV
jgi:ketosteroid isomerase-like protein